MSGFGKCTHGSYSYLCWFSLLPVGVALIGVKIFYHNRKKINYYIKSFVLFVYYAVVAKDAYIEKRERTMSRSAFENSGIDRVVRRKGKILKKTAGLWYQHLEKEIFGRCYNNTCKYSKLGYSRLHSQIVRYSSLLLRVAFFTSSFCLRSAGRRRSPNHALAKSIYDADLPAAG